MIKTRRMILIMIVLISFMPVFVFAGTIELPETGQAACYDTAGSVITCTGTGQDGDVQAGVSWPSPRFANNGDGTVTDNLTGLMWTQDGNAPGTVSCSPATYKTWQGALNYVACLNANSYLGYTDWRLPNVNELESMVNAGQGNGGTWLNTQGFLNVQSGNYWSSTTYASNTDLAWIVPMWSGSTYAYNKSNRYGYVWPVRSGQSGVAQLWETGQTTCYNSEGRLIACTGTGQDGEIVEGVSWPGSRFTAGTGTETDCVTDNLTGLMWTKNANPSGMLMTWQKALDYTNGASLCGYTDWRLPNRKELQSLTDFSRNNPALPSGHPFLNVQSTIYWSSSTYAYYKYYAWIVDVWYGSMYAYGKSGYSYVWPVRSGQVGPSVYSILGDVTNGTNGTGLSGVTMILSGAVSDSTTTAADGTYSFTGLADGNYTVTPVLTGNTFTPPNRSVTGSITGVDFMLACVQNTYYEDADSDSYGNAWVTTYTCTKPLGYVSNSADCNDHNALINPGATETANAVDDNCNGQVDEGMATTNNPPTKPNLTEPANSATGMPTTLTLKWEIASDADGDPVTYKLYIGTDTSFADVAPVIVASASNKNDSAMAFRYSIGLIGLFGIVTIGGLSKNRRRIGLLIIPIIIVTGFIFTSCSSGGGGNNNSNPAPSESKSYQSYTVTNLKPNTTYYWKVVADDGKGGMTESDKCSFTTGG